LIFDQWLLVSIIWLPLNPINRWTLWHGGFRPTTKDMHQ